MARKSKAAAAEATVDATAPAPEVTATVEPTPVVEAKPEKVKVEREHQNGITRPLPDSITGRLWAIADRISDELGRPAPRKDVVAAFKAELGEAANMATAHTQYARWVQFYDAADELKKARADEKAAKEQARVDAKAKKDAEKAEKARIKAEEKAARDAEKANAKEVAPAEGAPAA